MQTAAVVLEALEEIGVKGPERVATIYAANHGRTLSLAIIKSEWERIKGTKGINNASAVMYAELTKPAKKSTSHMADRTDVLVFDGQAYINDELPEWMGVDKRKEDKAVENMATLRKALLAGKKLDGWQTQLLEDCNRHTDMSMLSVAWVMEENGAML